jgi:drug/metabolite transporter (DMT)-like permease
LSWVAYALIGAALAGLVAIVDSHLLSRRLPGLASYLLPLGIFHLTAGIIILIVQPFPTHATVLALVAAFSTGLFGGIGSVMMLNLMRSGEVSRIIPVVSTSPIFVALLAIPFFHEVVNLRDWLGIIITVGGAFLISVQKDAGDKKAKLQKSFLAMIFISLMYAFSMLATKYALESLSFWNLYSANAIVFSLVFLVCSVRVSAFKQVKELPNRNWILPLIVGAQSIIIVAIVISNVAMQRGPVSIVATLGSTRPAFVFLFALLVSRFFPRLLGEKISRGIIFLKFTAIAMIVGGVALLTL